MQKGKSRRTGTESELGARFDSIADLILVVVCLVRILPAITVPLWLWVWVALIIMVKAANVISGFVVEKRLVLLHTCANKIAGVVVFLVTLALPFMVAHPNKDHNPDTLTSKRRNRPIGPPNRDPQRIPESARDPKKLPSKAGFIGKAATY